ncbi:DUF397 domain-containing protein [Nocardia cerradoensis]|uniref:DUF397 domain-containing protein n=1 Tax=Nocardia cerradoensis TaxID=85688 RepID=A0A231H8A1_9NOCA|nr:DUF397 domain-containing protein [Nocardia cerradoensis]NKY44546.1 DUF397 domain-containing protein [Nocardia cerradoensis]OXR44956.1 hypothetical protein B7C42_02913 [Nocardia cerradoensis]
MSNDLSTAKWFKSSRSTSTKDCVEVAFLEDGVGVRDSKNPAGPVLVFTSSEWSAFTTGLEHGRFDHA